MLEAAKDEALPVEEPASKGDAVTVTEASDSGPVWAQAGSPRLNRSPSAQAPVIFI
jgi:hypothetical protein